MAFEYKNIPVLSKIDLGGQVYYLKDADVRAILDTFGDAVNYNVDTATLTAEGNLATVGAIKAYVEEAVKDLAGAMHFAGAVDALPGVEGYEDGDVIIVTSTKQEYIFSNGAWVELGLEGTYLTIANAEATYEKKANLKALAYKDNASGTYTIPTVAPVNGEIKEFQSATDAEIDVVGATVTCTPAGTVTGNVTATGNVTGTVDITGTVAAPEITITPATAEVQHVANVGTLPVYQEGSYTAPSATTGTITHLVASETVTDETLSIQSQSFNVLTAFDAGSYTAPVYTAGTLPTLSNAMTVVTGITEAKASAPVFTGGVKDINATFVGNQVAIDAAFAGETATNAVSGGKVTALNAAGITAANKSVLTGVNIGSEDKNITVQ